MKGLREAPHQALLLTLSFAMDGKKPGDDFRPGPSPGHSGSPGRLPSFKKKRDLTLGEAKKKSKFVPNFNVQRIKKEKEEPGVAKADARAQGQGQGARRQGHHKGEQQQQDGKSRPGQQQRGRPELIQTTGAVFSEGVAGGDASKRRSGGVGGIRVSSSLKEEPGLGRAAIKVDHEEEERRRKALLRDDFVSDQEEGLFVPVQLPMICTGKVFKKEGEEEDLLKQNVDAKAPKKKKINVIDSDDDEDDIASAKETDRKGDNVKASREAKSAGDVNFLELIKQEKGDLLFLQLPDHLPGSVAQVKREEGESVSATSAGVKKEPVDTKDIVEKTRHCTLKELPEGYLGRIQVRKSGKTQIVIGENVFDVEMGTQVGFLQDLVSVHTSDIPQEVGDMTVLGHVKHRLVLTPDWESILDKAGDPSDLPA